MTVSYAFTTRSVFMAQAAFERAQSRGFAIAPSVPLVEVPAGHGVIRFVDREGDGERVAGIVGIVREGHDRQALESIIDHFDRPTPALYVVPEVDESGKDLDTSGDLELVGTAEVAERLGVRPKSVGNWRRRQVGFPEPLATVSGIAVWNWCDVEAWSEGRRAPQVASG